MTFDNEVLNSQIDATRSLANDILDNFAKYGAKAAVDSDTGEVVLDFSDQYFEIEEPPTQS